MKGEPFLFRLGFERTMLRSATRRLVTVILLMAGLVWSAFAQLSVSNPVTAHHPLRYRGAMHVADGKLATDLTIAKGASFSTPINFPDAAQLGLRKTWACWIFPEDTWAIGGDSEIELYVDDRMVTHFAVAKGEWKALIQSLAERITAHVSDSRKTYRITLKNAGRHDVFIRELWVRWLTADPTRPGS